MWHINLCYFVFLFSLCDSKPTLNIFNGTDAKLGEFPFAVQILEGTDHPLQGCGGSIVSKDWVMTAAHCVALEPTFIGTETVNFWKWDMPAGGQKAVEIEEAFAHPNYSQIVYRNGSWDILNDIALLKLKTPLIFNNVSQPVKLPSSTFNPVENATATVIGWGYIDNYPDFPKVLQKANLTLYSNSYCKTWFKNAPGMWPWHDEQFICAGDNEKHVKGPCTQDSGSPLVVDGVQVGIVSWSIKPCISGPAVFTKVANYRNWIRKVTGV